jgi:hypothetical protein
VLEPRAIFQTLYRSAVRDALHILGWYQAGKTIEELVGVVECRLVEQFELLDRTGQSSLEFRREQLRASSGRICQIRSNEICLVCLFRVAQHRLDCGHTLCDLCAQLFGTPAPDIEYKFTIDACLCCLYQRPLVIDVLPPTMNPTVLAIDGGGVRGVIPLEFLILVQESLGCCPLQDLIDLGVGTSSGMCAGFNWNAFSLFPISQQLFSILIFRLVIASTLNHERANSSLMQYRRPQHTRLIQYAVGCQEVCRCL